MAGSWAEPETAVLSLALEVHTRIMIRTKLGSILVAAILSTAFAAAQTPKPVRTPDVPYVPTTEKAVEEMLKLAKVQKSDVLYDLGCGDGRIVITAAKLYGTRGVGIDINPERIKEANENLKNSGVGDKVKFIQGDLFEMDLSPATVITLYLLPALNLKLRPKILKLKPGTRIVSHDFDMGDWKPEKTVEADGKTVYFWTIPKR
jgi:SAM-dependent methyltransferase